MKSYWILGLLLLTNVCPPANGAPMSASAKRWEQKDFLVTFWCPPPANDETLARVAAEGFNLTWTPEAGLDVAARHHLRAMLTSEMLRPEVLDDAAKRAELDSLIARVKHHPALEAYHIVDEPGAGAFPGLGKLVAWNGAGAYPMHGNFASLSLPQWHTGAVASAISPIGGPPAYNLSLIHI